MEKKPLSVKGLFDKNAVPASLTAVVFMFTYGALENFAAKFAAEKGLPSGGLFFVIMAVTVLIMRMTAGKVTAVSYTHLSSSLRSSAIRASEDEEKEEMDTRPIGVFDSGVGGLTVVKQIMKVMPHEMCIRDRAIWQAPSSGA